MSVFRRDPLRMMDRAYDYRQWNWPEKAQDLMNQAVLEYFKQEEPRSKGLTDFRQEGQYVKEIEETEASEADGLAEPQPNVSGPWWHWNN